MSSQQFLHTARTPADTHLPALQGQGLDWIPELALFALGGGCSQHGKDVKPWHVNHQSAPNKDDTKPIACFQTSNRRQWTILRRPSRQMRSLVKCGQIMVYVWWKVSWIHSESSWTSDPSFSFMNQVTFLIIHISHYTSHPAAITVTCSHFTPWPLILVRGSYQSWKTLLLNLAEQEWPSHRNKMDLRAQSINALTFATSQPR